MESETLLCLSLRLCSQVVCREHTCLQCTRCVSPLLCPLHGSHSDCWRDFDGKVFDTNITHTHSHSATHRSHYVCDEWSAVVCSVTGGNVCQVKWTIISPDEQVFPLYTGRYCWHLPLAVCVWGRERMVEWDYLWMKKYICPNVGMLIANERIIYFCSFDLMSRLKVTSASTHSLSFVRHLLSLSPSLCVNNNLIIFMTTRECCNSCPLVSHLSQWLTVACGKDTRVHDFPSLSTHLQWSLCSVPLKEQLYFEWTWEIFASSEAIIFINQSTSDSYALIDNWKVFIVVVVVAATAVDWHW